MGPQSLARNRGRRNRGEKMFTFSFTGKGAEICGLNCWSQATHQVQKQKGETKKDRELQFLEKKGVWGVYGQGL